VASLKQFKLPDVGEGLTEADIVRWYVKPGDVVTQNQIIVEIETAKALVELPCPFAGVVSELLVSEGSTVDVGTPIIIVDVAATSGSPSSAGDAGGSASGSTSGSASGSATGSAATLAASEATATEPAAGDSAGDAEDGSGGDGDGENNGRTAVLVGYGPRTDTPVRRRARQAAPPPARPTHPAHAWPSVAPGVAVPNGNGHDSFAEPTAEAMQQATFAGEPAASGVLAKPPVRKLARDLGIDISALSGTGPDGTVTRSDVEAAADASRGGATAARAMPRGGEERIPIRGVRKSTAQAMVSSAFSIPHVTEFVTIDVTRSVRAVKRLRELPEFADVKVSPLLLVAKAVLLGLERYPLVNSMWDDPHEEIVVRHYVNLGIAAATPRGLVVPNVKNAEALSLVQLARQLNSLTATAREGRTSVADMQHGTFTITNVGIFGIDTGTPIINPGEAAILALGAIREQPWVHRGKIRPRSVTTLALSFDHRIIDGELGSMFLRDVAMFLEDPASSLLARI
jgi:pyruvate dehydrogenase E2 component (dihydrolipoamide acetyltransferase)